MATTQFSKMPKNYNFDTKKKNWAEYENDFLLRTDAVWEKEQLKDYFRLYSKCFYFDTVKKQYSVMEPEDTYTILYESWALDEMVQHPGFTPTGRTNCFQVGVPPRDEVHVPFATFQQHEDSFNLCTLRFDKWFKCDQAHGFKMPDPFEAVSHPD